MDRSLKIPHAVEQPGLCASTKHAVLGPELCTRSRHAEKPAHRNEGTLPLSTARESPCETVRHSAAKNKINVLKKKKREREMEKKYGKEKKRDKIIKTIPKTQVVQGARIIGHSL